MPPESHASRSGRRAAILAPLAALVVACVVETYPAPPRPLLRDTLRAAPSSSASTPMASPAASAAAPASPSAASPPDPPPALQPLSAPPPPDAYRACQTTDDCVATDPNGCCHDGRHLALNLASVDAYHASFTCPVTRPRCPMHIVLDRRVPVCAAETHTCELMNAPPADGGPPP